MSHQPLPAAPFEPLPFAPPCAFSANVVLFAHIGRVLIVCHATVFEEN